MAALGRLSRVLTSGMISLVLGATSSAALAEGSDLDTMAIRLPSDALGEDAVDAQGDVESDGDTDQSEVSLNAAAVETIILHTLSAADLQALVRETAGDAVLETDPRVSALGAELDLREEALARMLEMLGGQDVPPERLAQALATIVARHKTLLARLQHLEASDPRAAELKDAVAAALETAEYELVDALLADAGAIGFEAMLQLLAAL